MQTNTCKNYQIFTAILWLFFSLTLSFRSQAMSLMDIGKVCTFSSISGVITNDGKPVSHANIKRQVEYQNKYMDETTTDENGYFELPAIYERSLAKLLPQELAITQSIFVYDDDQEYKIWAGVKRYSEENSESRGKPLSVKCDLTNEKNTFKLTSKPL